MGVAPGLNGGLSDHLALLWIGVCVSVCVGELGFGGTVMGSHFLSQAQILESSSKFHSFPSPTPQRTLTTETDHTRRPHTNRLPSGAWPWLGIPLFAQQQPFRNLSWTTFPTHLRVGGWKERVWSGPIALEALARSTPGATSGCCKPKLGWFVCWL